ncbi:hypothetical protein EGW08_017507 [Elysia chlorotica]|uniref:Uncharacterized protein n=1 Tax=Elysia chlorotica TaxID=188477 RepID=A0A3S0ZCR3_ELYCH|nr:hypothetical protein EGW08_017507 [Elysia chlorotica]
MDDEDVEGIFNLISTDDVNPDQVRIQKAKVDAESNIADNVIKNDQNPATMASQPLPGMAAIVYSNGKKRKLDPESTKSSLADRLRDNSAPEFTKASLADRLWENFGDNSAQNIRDNFQNIAVNRKKEIAALKEDVKKLELQIKDEQTKNAEYTKKNQELQDQLSKRLEESELSHQDLQNKLSKTQNELRNKISEEEIKNAECTNKNQELQNQIHELRNANTQLTKEFNDNKTKNVECMNQNQKLQEDKLQFVEKEKEVLTARFEWLNEKFKESEMRENEYFENWKKVSKNNTELESQITAINNDGAQCTAVFQNKIGELNGEIKNLEKEIQTLKANDAILKSLHQELDGNHNELKEKFKESEMRKNEQEDILQSVKKEKEVLTARFEGLNERFKESELRKNEYLEKWKIVSKKNAELENEITAINNDGAQTTTVFKNKISELREQNEKLEADLQFLKNNDAVLKSLHQELDGNYNELNENFQKSEIEKNKYIEKWRKVNEEKEELTQALQGQSHKLGSCEREKQELEKKVQKLEQERAKLASCENEKQELKKELNDLYQARNADSQLIDKGIE